MKQTQEQLIRSLEAQQIDQLMKTNQDSEKHSLVLTREDAAMLAEQKNETLKAERRVEFGESILPKLVQTFCDSAYIHQDDYVETLMRLQEIFFVYKNESMDLVSDNELLENMKEAFENEAGGDLDYLESTALEHFIYEIETGEEWINSDQFEAVYMEDYDEY